MPIRVMPIEDTVQIRGGFFAVKVWKGYSTCARPWLALFVFYMYVFRVPIGICAQHAHTRNDAHTNEAHIDILRGDIIVSTLSS